MDRATVRLSFISVLMAVILVAVLGMTIAFELGTPADTALADAHTHDGYTAWTATDSLPTEGNYYLTDNVTVSDQTIVQDGNVVNLCLNGYSVTNTVSRIYLVNNGGTLHIYDDVGSGSMRGEKLNNNYDSSIGTVVRVAAGGYFELHGGTLYGSSTPGKGYFTVLTNGEFVMSGGMITEENDQFGVQAEGANSVFRMTGGTITNCKGGGVHIYGGTAYISGGTISNNGEARAFGGVLLLSDYATSKLFLSGNPTIVNNTNNQGVDCNVNLYGTKTITIDGALTNTTPIGVTRAIGTFTSGWSTYMEDADPADYFVSDNAAYEAYLKNGEVCIGTPPHKHDGIIFEAWTSSGLPNTTGNWYLAADVTIDSTWNIPTGTTNLCLNGHGIRMTGSASVIAVGTGCTLSLYDCQDTVHYFDIDTDGYAKNINESSGDGRGYFEGGYITGGFAKLGGGLCVDGGTFNMYGGNIIGNRAYNNGNRGGGVYIESGACVTMYGGAVCYNYAQNTGAGFYVNHGTFTLLGGVISHNKTDWAGGGGVSVQNNNTTPLTVFNLFGGVIENNDTKNNYGAIDVSTGANVQFNVKGNAVVRNNYSGTTDNIHNVNLRSDYSIPPLINIVGELDGAYIGVAIQSTTGTFTSGWSTNMGEADPADYFVSDNAAYEAYLKNGEVCIGTPPHKHDGIIFEAWTSSGLPNTTGNWYLAADMSISDTWVVPTGTVNLCLCGHGIRMTGNNSVVTINAGATLKLYDCDTTTEHRYSLSNAKSNGAGFATVNDSLTSGYLTFKGGYVTGGRGRPISNWNRGGALYIEGAVEMYGGTLIGNGQYGTTHGGAFNTQGTGSFKMYGGSIQNNAAQCGGATRLQGSGSCEIYGGKIINNIVTNDGGAIHVGGEISVILQDCEISGNYAGNGPGAGIWMTTTGMVISGRTIITDNLTNSGESNVEIGNGYVIGVGELTDGATIGIKPQSGTGIFTSGWADVMGSADPADYFVSDNSAYIFGRNAAGEAIVGVPYTVSFDMGGHGTAIDGLTVAGGGIATEPNAPTDDLYLFDGWYREATCDTAWDYAADTVSANITLYAKWEEHPHTWAYTASGNVIYATCTFNGCEVGTQALTLRAESKEYDGMPVTATITASSGWIVANGLDMPEITYSGNTDVGVYTASITVGDVSVSVEFRIFAVPQEKQWRLTGTVKDGTTPVVGAELTLMQGNNAIAVETTDAQGNYYFVVDEGVYNLVVAYADTTATAFVALYADTEKDISITGDKTESKLNVVTEEDLGIAVGGLEKEAQDIRAAHPEALSVTVQMTIEPKTEETAANATPIVENIKNKRFAFLDITVEQMINEVRAVLDNTTNVMEIAIPYAKINRRGLTVYSYHDNTVRTFVESNSRENGTYRVDKENGYVYVYTNSFSTYAIGYTPYYRMATALSLGGYTGNVTVTLDSQEEDLSYTLEDVEIANVCFADVAMGTYTMTVTWRDGAVNTLKMTISVGPDGIKYSAAPAEEESESVAAAAEATPEEEPSYWKDGYEPPAPEDTAVPTSRKNEEQEDSDDPKHRGEQD